MPDTWDSLQVSEILPSGFPTLVDLVTDVLDPIQTILTTAINGIEIIQPFIIDFTDPLAAIVNGVINQIEVEVTSFLNTGVFFAYSVPKNLDDKKGASDVARQFMNSIYDPLDHRRPVFAPSETAGAMVIMVGGPSIDDLVQPMELLNQILDINEIAAFLDMSNPAYLPERLPYPDGGGTVSNVPSGQNPRTHFRDLSRAEEVDPFKGLRIVFRSGRNEGRYSKIRSFDPTTRTFEVTPLPYNLEHGDLYEIILPQGSSPPDWSNIRVANVIPPMGNLMLQLQTATRMIASGVAATTAINDFITALNNKATQLSKLVTYLNEQVAFFQSLVDTSGIYILRLEPDIGGTDAIGQRLLASLNTEGAPPFESGVDYTFGAMFVTGGPAYEVLAQVL